MKALAVDNEPEPFWTGDDQTARVDAWKAERKWTSLWGSIEPAQRFNGPSGQWLSNNVLKRLGVDRTEVWITDCLDTYRASTDMRSAIDTVYRPFAADHGLPPANLPGHPSEAAIVSETTADHLERLRLELRTAGPQAVITLGNAALRVLRELMDTTAGPSQLSSGSGYGESVDIAIEGAHIKWCPLAHPAAPPAYQQAHKAWNVGIGN